MIDLDALRELLAELLADDSAGRAGRRRGAHRADGGGTRAVQVDQRTRPSRRIRLCARWLRRRCSPGSSKACSETAHRMRARTATTNPRSPGGPRRGESRTSGRWSNGRHGGAPRNTSARERVAKYGVPKLAEEVDFLRASDADMVALRRSVTPLARLLASRLAARRRRSRAGAIDLRRTLRKSMSTGGVPIDLVNRKPRPARPELVVLCDVSGSVAGFSHFTLLLVHALREQFSRVRVFAFIDTTDEVTRLLFDRAPTSVDAMSRMLREADLITYDGHSDYGHALGDASPSGMPTASPARSSLLILGDGRNNYRDPNLGCARASRRRRAARALAQSRAAGPMGLREIPRPARTREVIDDARVPDRRQLAAVVAGLLPV